MRRSSSASSPGGGSDGGSYDGEDADLISNGPPVWMEDDQSSACLCCARPFSTFVRRHHCRACGVLVCSKCSSHRNAKSQRTCDNCHASGRRGSVSTFGDRMSSPPTPRHGGGLAHSATFTSGTTTPMHSYPHLLSAQPTPHATPRQQQSQSQLQSQQSSPHPAPPAVVASMPSVTSPLAELSVGTGGGDEDEAGPVWLQDKQSAECMLCFRAFTMLLRRHHCRNCGILVCSKCSAHRVTLPTTKGGSTASLKAEQRVCDTCFAAPSGLLGSTDDLSGLDSPASSPTHAVNHEEITSVAMLADPNLALPPLPPWAYAFGGAGSGVGEMIPLGRLYVRVIAAVNLPAMNRLMGTTDPYCTLHCAGQSHRTRIVTNSLNPRFDEDFYFDVLSAREDKLTLMIYDWDQLGKDKHVAYLTVPLSELSHSHRTTRWYEISNLSEQARKASNMKEMNQDRLKAEMRRKDRELLAEAGGNVSNVEVRVARPRVQLELQYLYAESGALFSHVVPSDPEHPSLSAQQNEELIPQDVFHAPPSFDVDVLYSDLWRLLDLLKPVTSTLAEIGPILAWTTPHISFLVLAAFVLVCFQPFMFLVLIEVMLLKALGASYLRRVDSDLTRKAGEVARVLKEYDAVQQLVAKKKSNILFAGVHGLKNLWTGAEDDAPAALNARSQSLLQRLNPLTTAPDGRALDVKDRSLMNGLVTNALNGLLVTFGLHGNLAQYQAMFTGYCDQIEKLNGILSWEDRTITGYITIALGVLLVYSIFLPQKYLFLLAGGYVLTMGTPPSKRTLEVFLGLVAYMAVRRSRDAPPPAQAYATQPSRRR